MVSNDGDRRKSKDRRGEDRSEAIEDRRSSANRRREIRIKKRLPCEFVDGDKSVRGFVLDVSQQGIFVQTLRPVDPGGEVGISFTPPGFGQAIEVRACVVRSLRVPPHLATVATAGVGLRIKMAPPEYYDFIASLSHHDVKAATASNAPAASESSEKPKQKSRPKAKPKKRKLPPRMPKPETQTRYRVLAKQTGGPRSRSLILRATSLEHAAWQALEQIGSDWEIVDVKLV
jgi:hypothetical protein